jgi:hypothetical protein
MNPKDAQALAWHTGLVARCRPYRETHLTVLRSVSFFLRGRYGVHWWKSEAARQLAVQTLRYFKVEV